MGQNEQLIGTWPKEEVANSLGTNLFESIFGLTIGLLLGKLPISEFRFLSFTSSSSARASKGSQSRLPFSQDHDQPTSNNNTKKIQNLK
jgi:hypothetical protein